MYKNHHYDSNDEAPQTSDTPAVPRIPDPTLADSSFSTTHPQCVTFSSTHSEFPQFSNKSEINSDPLSMLTEIPGYTNESKVSPSPSSTHASSPPPSSDPRVCSPVYLNEKCSHSPSISDLAHVKSQHENKQTSHTSVSPKVKPSDSTETPCDDKSRASVMLSVDSIKLMHNLASLKKKTSTTTPKVQPRKQTQFHMKNNDKTDRESPLNKQSRNNKGQIMSLMKRKLIPEKELDTSNIVKQSRSESCGK